MRHISIHLFSLVIPCLFMSFCPPSALCPFLFTPFPNQVSNQGFQFEGRLSLPLLLVWGIMFWVLDQSQFKKHLCNILLSYICHLYCWSRWLKNAIVTPGPIKHWLDFLMNLGNGKGKKNHPTRVKHVGQNEILIFFCMVKNTTPPPHDFHQLYVRHSNTACMLPNASLLISMETTHPDTTVSAIP